MPYSQDVHVDQALTTLSIAYKNTGYIADTVLPPVPVDKRSDLYFLYDKSAFKRRDLLIRQNSVAPQMERTVSRAMYNCERYALRELVSDTERRESDQPLNPDVDTTEVLTDAVMNQREFMTVAFITNTANVPQNLPLSGTTQWSDYTNSTPLSNLRTAKSSVRLGALHEATDLTLSYDVGQVLADHPSIKELIKYTDPNNISSSGLPNTVRGLKVNIAGAFEDNTNQGATPVLTTAFGMNALVHYTTDAPGLKTISFGYRFEAPDPTTGVRGFSTIRYRSDERHGDYLEVGTTFDNVIVTPNAAFLFTTAA